MLHHRFPLLEDLYVHFKMRNHGARGMHVDLQALRKLSVKTPSKNLGGLRSLHAPNLELFIFQGGGAWVVYYAPV